MKYLRLHLDYDRYDHDHTGAPAPKIHWRHYSIDTPGRAGSTPVAGPSLEDLRDALHAAVDAIVADIDFAMTRPKP